MRAFAVLFSLFRWFRAVWGGRGIACGDAVERDVVDRSEVHECRGYFRSVHASSGHTRASVKRDGEEEDSNEGEGGGGSGGGGGGRAGA